MSELTDLLAAEAARQRPARQPAFAGLLRAHRRRTARRRTVGAAAVLLAAAGIGTVLMPAAPSTPAQGVPVSGVLLEVGGPLGTPSRGVAGTVRFATADGRAVTAAAAGDGRFTIAVPPGTYTVTGAPSYASGAAPCRADAPVTVPAAGATDVQVICHIR